MATPVILASMHGLLPAKTALPGLRSANGKHFAERCLPDLPGVFAFLPGMWKNDRRPVFDV